MYCQHCGKEVGDKDLFCKYCGKCLQTAQAPKSTGNGVASSSQQAKGGVRVLSVPDPLFRVKCEYCRCEFEYKLANLGYRMWYPSGFVYCPNCKKPLRHRLEYEVKPGDPFES